MSYAVMPLSDYKATCDKVREKVDNKLVLFEDKGFGYLVSEPFLVEAGKTYTLNAEFSNNSLYSSFVITGVGWKGDTSPWIAETTLPYTFTGYDFLGCCVYFSTDIGLTANDIISANIECDKEIIADFVAPPKIKSGELADKVEEVYEAGASDFGLKGKGQGELVHFENVHPIEHKVEVGLGSKNLFNEAEANITKNEDYFSSNANYWESPCLTISVESGATYTATVEYHTPNTTNFNAIIAFSISTEKTYTTAAKSLMLRTKTENSTTSFTKTVSTFTIPDGVEEIYFIANNDETYFKNVMVEKNSTPTAYAPYIADFSDCKVKVIGKNLFDKTDYIRHSDGTIGFSVKNLVEGETYTISTNIPIKQFKVSNAPWGYSSGSAHNDNGFAYHTWKHTRVEQISESATLYIHFTLVGETSMVSDISQLDGYEIQIEYGTTPSEYTEYIEPTEYTAAADGTVEGVKSISPVMNISTDKAGAVIDAECFLDPQAVITDLTNTVITLGGEI